MKTCTKCKVEKPYDAFYDDPRYRDHCYPWCRKCKSKSVMRRQREKRQG